MIGIYKIKNKINNKVYIGQSSNITNRFNYYTASNLRFQPNSLILKAIHKYGLEFFEFSILEECSVEDLNKKEIYYISLYNSTKTGYNMTTGGDHNVGSANPMADLSEEDIKFIRELYNSKTYMKKYEIYEKYFKHKCGKRAFEKAWNGETWTHIMMNVYTQENIEFYSTVGVSMSGSKNGNAALTDDLVNIARKRYVNESGKDIYVDYQQYYSSYSGFEKMLLGTTYSYLPIYKKREKRWVNC